MSAVPEAAAALLRGWLERQLPAAAWRWLDEQLRALGTAPAERDLFVAIGMVPRKVGKADLTLDDADMRAAERCRPGWRPRGWSVDQAARIVLLLSTGGSGEGFERRLRGLCDTADVSELIAFYRGLPLYPEQARHVARAAEGIRTNMKAVFEAVAHHNPYPAEQLPEEAWNQMVLKALFIGSPLHPIMGLDARANPRLARMLCEYAHERWAAGREVSPALWRCVGPHADDAALEDLGRVLERGAPREREAAALALSAARHPRAAALLDSAPELAARVRRGALAWADPPGASRQDQG